jgi:ubiquinone biosynthesis monooxygenase Coq7
MSLLNNPRQFVDSLIVDFDQGMKTLFGVQSASDRVNPGNEVSEQPLTRDEIKHSAALMRINHVGEVCAQALYQGQAITARTPRVKNKMQQAAAEEVDHLVWCQQRLEQLNSHTSYFNPFWYTGSLALGLIAGIAGDQWSLGFVAETERQVVQHLDDHLHSLPKEDAKSRAIVTQMREDESYHATVALEAGAVELPEPIKVVMRLSSKFMTSIAYWV